MAVHVDVEHGGFLLVRPLLFEMEHSRYADVISGGHPPCNIVLDMYIETLGGFATPESLGGFLYPKLLGVDELRLVEVDSKRPLAFTALTLVWLLKVAAGLGDSRQRATALALEGRLLNFGPHISRFADDPAHPNEGVDVLRANVSDIGRAREVRDPDVGLSEAHVDR